MKKNSKFLPSRHIIYLFISKNLPYNLVIKCTIIILNENYWGEYVKKLIRNFRIFSIKKQFFILTSITILTLSILCIYMRISMKNALMDTNMEYVEALTDKFTMEISSITQQIDNICTQLQYNTATSDLLSATSYQDINVQMINAINQQKTSIFWLNDSIIDIAFVNDRVQWSSFFSKADLMNMRQKVSSHYGAKALGTYRSSAPSQSDIPAFVFSSPMFKDHVNLGTIFVSINLQKQAIQLPSIDTLNSWFLLYDANSHITPFNCSQETATEIFDSCRDIIFANGATKPENFRYSFSNDSYIIQIAYLEDAQSYIISAIDIHNTNEKLNYVYRLTWSIIIFCCLFQVLLGMILYFNFITPLNEFNKIILHIKEKRLRKPDKPLQLKGCTEVIEIGNAFSDMLFSIHDLNTQIVKTSNDLYEAELQRKISELSLLKSQINPHFLYNTLELVRSISQKKQIPEISHIVVSMAKILRYSIKGDDFVSLEQELEITEAYINIQRARFSEKFNVIISITDEARNAMVIKMLLQPLVENAIFHGLEPKNFGGILYIGGAIENDTLIITIRDNGIGIAPEVLLPIQKSLTSKIYDTSKHIGLVNTNARMKLQYGEAYGLNIESSIGDGTCVTLSLPITPS